MSEMSCDDMLADSPRRYSCSMLTQKPYYFNCAGCTCKPPPCAEHNMPSCEGKYCALVGKDADGKQEGWTCVHCDAFRGTFEEVAAHEAVCEANPANQKADQQRGAQPAVLPGAVA